MNYEHALKAAWNGKAVLFYGSGFSRGAISIDGSDFPTGTSLAKRLCRESNIKENPDLRTAATRYIKRKDPQALVDLLCKIFTVKSVTDSQQMVAQVPWKSIFTTNYDGVMERSAANCGKVLRPIELTDNPRNYYDDSSYVLHINGYIDSLTQDSLFNSFKLTSTSYLTEKFKESPWSAVFTRQIQAAHAVFFIGYSLYDLEIQEILFADKTLKDKTFFIEYPGLDDEEVELSDLNDFGTLLPIGVDKFSADLFDAKKDLADENAQTILTGFIEQNVPSGFENPARRDADVFDLLIQGRVNEKLLWADSCSRNAASEYVFLRDAIDETLSIADNIENIVVTSDLGNGKTLFATQIGQLYLARGYRVFWLLDESLDCYDDIASICAMNLPVLIVVENYARKTEIIQHFNIKRRQGLMLLLTERSVVHENTEEELYYSKKIIDVNRTREIDLNKLSNDDIKRAAAYFEKYGLWGEKAGLSESQKINYIVSKCSSELHGLLLGILESGHIQESFKSLFASITSDNKNIKTIVTAFVLKMLGVSDPTPHTIAAMSQETAIFQPAFRLNGNIKQLFNSRRGSIAPKSSVLAEFSLQNFSNIATLVSALVEIAKSTRMKAVGDEIYWKYYRELASFKNIQKMLPEKGKRESLIKFYEGLREIELERKNPHFWLQYAIARLTFPDAENLSHVKTYLDTALALASKKERYTTTDIETQYARYHLEYANNTPLDSNAAFEQFKLASAILTRITSIETFKKEPYRPARLYEVFFKKYAASFSEIEIDYIKTAISELLENSRRLPPRIYSDKGVQAALDVLRSVQTLVQRQMHKIAMASR